MNTLKTMKTLRWMTVVAMVVVSFLGAVGFARADGPSATDFAPGPSIIGVLDFPPGPNSGSTDGCCIIYPRKPDLSTTMVYVGNIGGVPGYPTTRPVTVDIKNYGPATPSGFWVHFRTTNNVTLASKWMDPMAAYTTKEVTILGWKDTCVKVVLDPTNTVSELHEDNNITTGCH